MFRILSILLALAPVLLLSAQETGEFHEFTDKKGSKILATLLDVSEDRRMMKIRREDGQEFESEINALSLDDQQYVKSWMKSRPMMNDYRIDLMVSRKPAGTERRDGNSSSYEYVQRFFHFEVKVRNLSRETLPPTRLEYAVVWDDQLLVYQADDGDWNYDLADEEEESVVKLLGEAELPSIPFNREEVVTTDDFELSELLISGDLYREDEAYGIAIRVVTESGVVLAESKVGSSDLDHLEWDQIIALDDPAKRD